MKNYLIILTAFIGLSGLKPEMVRNISGTVYSDFDKKPLPGVNVSVLGAGKNAVTDSKGYYSITMPDKSTRLIFNGVDCKPDTVAIGNDDKVDVYLKQYITYPISRGHPRLNGQDFAGGDVALAIRNLPPDIIDSIQVMDDYGDQKNITTVKAKGPASTDKVEAKKPIAALANTRPRINVDLNGNITAGGQTVTKASINGSDGGGDVTQAIKNLPAGIVETVYAMDDYGDQKDSSSIKAKGQAKILKVKTANHKARNIGGTVYNSDNHKPLPGVRVSVGGSATFKITNPQGHYFITIPKAKNQLIFALFNYKTDTLKLHNSKNLNVYLHKIAANTNAAKAVPNNPNPKSTTLHAVNINGIPSVVYKTDTVEYRASDYRVQANSTTDELLKHMEGMQVGANGAVMYQGQVVTKARINGKDYSGGDIKQATKNLPADVLESIQVIDDYGDQAGRTGVKDGDPTKVLNFTTKGYKNVTPNKILTPDKIIAPNIPLRRPEPVINTESYSRIVENQFQDPITTPLSTFAVDVDAASYSNVRRFINSGQLPPKNAVRIEEMVNYFHYNLPPPTDGKPVAIQTELSTAPWNPQHQLVRIGLKAKEVKLDKLPPSNLVFLLDVSGSMAEPNKLSLVKPAMKMLVEKLRPIDHVAIVVYAGDAGLKLASTPGNQKEKIDSAIDRLSAGGSTAGSAGIQLAYQVAKDKFIKGGNNRTILATDGDFNVGASSDKDMEQLIEDERGSGVSISILGFGMGNLKDSKMERMADKGHGNYAYIDNITEATKSMVSEFGGTLFTVAKDVKLQVEFNPGKVQAYRLLGYEDRLMAKEDFNNDAKVAGDMGVGHTVTALYEIIPVGVKDNFTASMDPLKYQQPAETKIANNSEEIMTVKFRYKEPDAVISKMELVTVTDKPLNDNKTSEDFRFAAAVVEYGLLLRGSQFKQRASFDQLITLARGAKGKDDDGYRAEFIRLAESTKGLMKGAEGAVGK